MKKFLNMFFVTLGVIFFFLIIAGIYFYITDPLGLRPLLSGAKSSPQSSQENTHTNDGTVPEQENNSQLSPTQQKALEAFGIDPSSVSTSISPEQKACFVEALGQERVEEIKAGDSPTATEFFKAKPCTE